MSTSEGLVTEPTEAEAGGDGGCGGDGGDRLKRRWGDKVYSRRLKKAKTIINSAVVSGEGSMDCDGVLCAVPTGDLASNAANFDKEESGKKTTNCVGLATVECPQLETLAGSVHGIDKLVCKDRLVLWSKSKVESQELKEKYEDELETVRGVMRKVGTGSEAFSQSEDIAKSIRRDIGGPLQVRHRQHVISAMLMPSGFTQRLQSTRPLNQLSVAVMGSNFGMPEMTEKRTPKGNQFHRDSEFILANDKFPSLESDKKSKANVKKNHGSPLDFRVGSKTFKGCSALLERLLKHQFSHILDSPVDVKGLGLHDYFTMIKQPMDLGTVRQRLNSNYYMVPREFAEDVRLTFYNAMTYNPEGHEVHTIARLLLKIFDEKWAAIETEYLRALKLAYNYDACTPTSTRSTTLTPSLLSPFGGRSLSRSQTMSLTPSGRIRAPKKPKARDLNKRDMTYAEKQKLSSRLQNLPVEKLDGVIQIIKQRDSSLVHQSNEIEVDIDAVDAETLWELDRFITNHRKSLRKMRRKQELASHFGREANDIVPNNIMATEPAHLEATKGAAAEGTPAETKMNDKIMMSSFLAPPTNVTNHSKSSSSSSSSSDTRSSSSSGSSSESSPDGYDARRSPAS